MAVEAGVRAAADATLQPLDLDLTAVAALSTTVFGRGLLALADAAAARATLGLGSAAVQATAAFDAAGAAVAVQAASQPIDSDLTAIAALSTTTYGRALLTLVDAAAGRTTLGLGAVDNTADMAKPVSTAQAAADALAIPLTQKAAASGVASLDGSSRVVQSPKLHHADHEPGGVDALTVDAATGVGSLRTLGTGTAQAAQGSVAAAHQANTSNPHSVTATQVGLGNVTNTSDTAKPVSTLQQAALDLKAPLASPALTGSPTAPTQAAADNSTKVATTAYADTADSLLVPKSLMDAKGDLFSGTADNTVARKAVGTNETSLLADSAQTDGLRWAYPRISFQQRAAMPAGAITEAGVGRYNAMSSQAVLTSGTLRLGGMCVLPKDVAIASITIPSGSTAAVGPTSQWFCLVRVSDLAVLRKTADDTTTAWGSGVNKTLSLSSTYTPAADELVYLGILVVAGTVPTILGWSINQSVTFIAPITCGNSTTGLTNPASLGGSALAVGASAPLSHYGYVS